MNASDVNAGDVNAGDVNAGEPTPSEAAAADPTASPGGVALTLDNLSVTFPGPVEAVAPLSISVAPGEFVSLLGPSGCGKSTLLRAVAGLQPHAGTAALTGPRDLAFVFQEPTLLPWRNVLRNVALPLELQGVSKTERLARARQSLAAVGLDGVERRYPAQLSGGMKMRCSLARALVTRPRLLLLDEPFAALDELSRQKLDTLLRDLWRQTGVTVLFVTHSVAEAVFLSTRALVFSPRPARPVLDLPIDLPPRRTEDLRTAPEFAAIARRLSQALRGQEAGR